MTPLAFVDTETTGLDPDTHEIWEVGLILRADDNGGVREDEYRWFLPVDLGNADPVALRIGGFHSRHPRGYDWQRNEDEYLTDLDDFATEFADLTRGAHLVGAVISFDEERLRKLLRYNGACPEWHYHLIDVEALAVGALAKSGHTHPDGEKPCWTPPWKSREIATALGVTWEGEHTAVGDARFARDIYDAVVGE